MAKDPEVVAHQEWLGYVQPVGLVVSTPALLAAQAHVNRNIVADHRRFLGALPPGGPPGSDADPIPEIRAFPQFARDVLDWKLEDLYGAPESPAIPDSLLVPLADYGETLRPTFVLREYEPPSTADPAREWLLLIEVVAKGANLDETPHSAEAHHATRNWQASPQSRFERLLRETGVPAGLLVNGTQVRLVYAPKGESSGHITFNIAEMAKVPGRPIFAAFHLLLAFDRLYLGEEKHRLSAILANSRKYQNEVSTKLAGQVLEALYELLRGFQAANDQTHGKLLRQELQDDPGRVYAGLLTTLLRLVFVLYAEDRGLLSTDAVYVKYYSVSGLFEKLRADAGRYPDTMDHRYGAWSQLLALFRLIYQGGSYGGLRIPPREGYLFDPLRYPFLEGLQGANEEAERVIPRVPDGVLYRVLSKLLILDGERLSYRTLDVEQIGSVYEAIMGFDLHVAQGRSIAIKPAKTQGAPATVNLETLLAVPRADRAKWLRDHTDQELTGKSFEALKDATSIQELLAALEKRIARNVTPDPVPSGAMIFQPSDERRRSGSHYTPRSLTEPIVRDVLTPVLRQLGENPTPEEILNLRVCDPAMGSGAFLVEACRQLGDALARAWRLHGTPPELPPDEDEILYARRQVAQRCLYGVDKNPLAADLAKLSLWLATLARDHAFTFLDHALRPGDSLVGLTRLQVAQFHWRASAQISYLEEKIRQKVDRVTQVRLDILSARDNVPYALLQQKLGVADDQLGMPRCAGDAVVAAFFSAEKPKLREQALQELKKHFESALTEIRDWQQIDEAVTRLRSEPKGIAPFHWELEFPEVFTVDDKGNPTGGFDAIVGNPPFAGKNTLINGNREGYLDWLQTLHEESHGNSDLVAHFFRRAFTLLRPYGRFGLIATNTIGQGDTRSTGLRWICTHGGTIYRARKRLKWPGLAAVVVSVVHVAKGELAGPFVLDGREVAAITAYLFHAGGNDNPMRLVSNADTSFQGYILLGMGFTFDDTDKSNVASSLEDMRTLVARDPHNQERIFPYIGGEEVNNSPTHAFHRYTISFENFPLQRKETGHSWFQLTPETQRKQMQLGIVAPDYPGSVATDWPDLLAVVRERVKPERDLQKRDANRERWWQYAEKRPGLTRAAQKLKSVLAINCGATPHMAFTFLDARMIYANTLAIIVLDDDASFCCLQSRVHELWARFFASSMKDDLRYTPTDCFETFPFPGNTMHLREVGSNYYNFRAKVMQIHDRGLTKLYNEFHDPNSEWPEISQLRRMHDEMDRVVLDAYGWTNVLSQSEFVPEFEDEESDNSGLRKRYRYRWPDETRDEVLARLLDLNRQRAIDEGQASEEPVTDANPPLRERRAHKKRAVGGDTSPTLLDIKNGDS